MDLIDVQSYLLDPATLDIHESDFLQRAGPKYGIQLSQRDAETILSRLAKSVGSYKVSPRGYNNRLYYLTTHTPGEEYIIKVCGRHWKRVKTETEVVGLWIARHYGNILAPTILAWDSTGHEFGVEYTVMKKLSGFPLDSIWPRLSLQAQRELVTQLAAMVIAFKTRVPEDVLPNNAIGNFSIPAGSSIPATEVRGFTIGQTLDGQGPWSNYKSFLRSQLERQMEAVQKQESYRDMRALLPRIERFLEALDMDETIVDTHRFVFTHGDLDLQNVLVSFETTRTSQGNGDDENDDGNDLTPRITAILDWEWSGMFPAEEEYFTSFNFLLSDPDNDDEAAENNSEKDNDANPPPNIHKSTLKSYFFDLLEAGGIDTPRTLPCFEQRRQLYKLRENLAPWYLADLDAAAIGSQQTLEKTEKAIETVMCALDALGY